MSPSTWRPTRSRSTGIASSPPASTAPRSPTTTTASSASATTMHPGVYIRSVYFQDPDGILLEFACWLREFRPDDVSHAPNGAVRPRPPGRARHGRRRRPRLHAPPPPGPQGRSHGAHRHLHVRLALRGPRPGRRTGTLGRHARRLVDGLRARSPTCSTTPSRASASTRAPTAPRPRAARARPDPRRLGRRQPVRLLPARQVHARARHARGEDHAHPRRGPSPSCYDAAERAVLAYTDCLVYDHGRVPDDALRRAAAPPATRSPSSSSPTSRRCTSSTP